MTGLLECDGLCTADLESSDLSSSPLLTIKEQREASIYQSQVSVYFWYRTVHYLNVYCYLNVYGAVLSDILFTVSAVETSRK